LSEIIQGQFADNSIVLTDVEKKEFDKLKQYVELDKKEYEKKFENVIIANHLKPELYREIEALYYKDQKFQKKVNKLNR
jgi:pyoverdine/dityrosine biosynthesis protein Dit1